MGDYRNGMMRNPVAGMQHRAKAQDRTTAKLIGQNHPTGLTPNLLRLFEPRPPPEYKLPIEKRQLPAYSGIAQFVSRFAELGDPEYAPPVPKSETRAEKKARIRRFKLEEGASKVAEELQKYDPQSDPNATGDPYKTLFVARLSYETSEHSLRREFEAYGPIKRVPGKGMCNEFFNMHDWPDFAFPSNCVDVYWILILMWKLYTCKVRLVTDKDSNKPRGYAFIEYVHTRDMKNAYKHANGRKVDNTRVLVDVERGRTVPNWRPRRLGGGLGSSRLGGEGAGHECASREQQLAAHPRSEEPRRDDRHADRDREKSRERVKERDRNERTHGRTHDRTREHESREERHSHRDRDRTRDKDHVRDRERDRARDRDRDQRDKGKHRDHGRDLDREGGHKRSHDRHRDRGRDGDRGYESAGHNRDLGQLHERDAEYGNVTRVQADYGYNQYEQGKGHDSSGYGLDGHGHETERSKRHEHGYYPHSTMAGNYQVQPNNTEREAPEEGEAY